MRDLLHTSFGLLQSFDLSPIEMQLEPLLHIFPGWCVLSSVELQEVD